MVALLLVPDYGLGADRFDLAAAAYQRGDYGAARKLWEDALADGDWDAARSLGTLYRRGLGVEADPARAVSYYRDAVDHGVLAAKLNLAEMMLIGQGTGKDVEGAKKLLAEASDKGAAFAKLRLEEIEEAESHDLPPPPLPERGIQPVEAATVPADIEPAGGELSTSPVVKAHVASYKSEKAAATGWLSFNLPGLVPATEWISVPGKGRFIRLYAIGPAPIVEQLCATLRASGEPCQTAPQPANPAATPPN